MANYYYSTPSVAAAAAFHPPHPPPPASRDTEWWRGAQSIYDFSAVDIDGREIPLSVYRGHICLIINVACK